MRKWGWGGGGGGCFVKFEKNYVEEAREGVGGGIIKFKNREE